MGSWLAYAVSAAGLCLVLIAALADRIGLGGSPGLGAEQVLGIAVGWTVFVLGGWLRLHLRGWKHRTRLIVILSTLALWLAPVVAVVKTWLREEVRSTEIVGAAMGQDQVDALIAIGYVDWSESSADPTKAGVTRWDRDRAHAGYTLIASRERPEVYLIDMSGRIAHGWSLPDTKGTLEGVRLLDNGDLLVISKYHELVRLDWHSEVIWRTPMRAHHDVTVATNGDLYTWVEEVQSFWGVPMQFDSIVKLSPKGRPLSSWSIREHLREIFQAFDPQICLHRVVFAHHLLRIVDKLQGRGPDRESESFHPNTVQLIGANAHEHHAAFRPGNLVICLRNINQIATLDPETMEILWTWGQGELEYPHHPTVLENGNILIFDNGDSRGYTRVIELDPIAGRIQWQYPADPDDPEHRFFAEFKGSAQRLENGNTLIGDGENGRSVEVTRDGEIVWEFFHPEVNELGQRALIYRSIRYPQTLVEELIEARGANLSSVPDW